jgi:hypothetical protein
LYYQQGPGIEFGIAQQHQKMLPGRSGDILTDQSFMLHISVPMFNTPFKLITAAPTQHEHILNALTA